MKEKGEIRIWSGTGILVVTFNSGTMEQTCEVFNDMEGGEVKILCISFYLGTMTGF